METEYGLVVNSDNMIKMAEMLTGMQFDSASSILDRVKVDAPVEYFDSDVNETTVDKAVYKLYPLELFDRKSSRTMFVSFSKIFKEQKHWQGCYVGTRQYLVNALTEKSKQLATKVQSSISAYQQVYDKLVDKEMWVDESKSFRFHRLENYLSGLLKRIENIKNDDIRCRYIEYSSDTKSAFINTGLLNLFGNGIRIKYNITDNGFEEPEVVESNSQLKKLGFKRFDVEVCQFFDKIEDVIFDRSVSMDSFDFSDSYRLTHVVKTRITRLKEDVQNMQEMDILARIKASIEYALKVAKIDYNFIIPQYSIAGNKIQFLIPLFIDLDFKGKPSGVLVVEDSDMGWQLMTLLEVEEAYKNARLVNKVSASWLKDAIT